MKRFRQKADAKTKNSFHFVEQFPNTMETFREVFPLPLSINDSLNCTEEQKEMRIKFTPAKREMTPKK